MAALYAPGAGARSRAGAPTAGTPPQTPSRQMHHAPPMTGGASGAGFTTVRGPSPSPSVQNAPPMAGVPRPASLGASGASATTSWGPSPSAPQHNGPWMTGVPRPVSFGAPGAATAAESAPSPAPPMQGAPQAGMVPAGPRNSHTAVAGIPTARPRASFPQKQMRGARAAMAAATVPRSSHTTVTVPSMTPHAPLQRTQGAPTRPALPTSSFPTGVSVMPTIPQAPRAQGVPSMAMSPGVPTIQTPTGNPHAPPQLQRTPMARHPAPTSYRAIEVPIQPTYPHAPLPNTRVAGAPPPRTMAPPPSQAPTSSAPSTAAAATPPRPQARAIQIRYIGVQQDSVTGKWAASVADPVDATRTRCVGAFPDAHAAALAHDRLSIAFHRDGARVNFGPAFNRVERDFLSLCMAQQGSPADALCSLVAAGGGRYDEKYTAFLRKIYDGLLSDSPCKRFMDAILDFFIDRAKEIGRGALEAGGAVLLQRFVDMHMNKATSPAWRQLYHQQMAATRAKKMASQQQQQGVAEKRKADGEDDRANKRREPSPETTQVSGTSRTS